MSVRGYSRYRGVTHESVRRALAAGRIVAEADGTIDPVRADRQWAASARPRIDSRQAPPPRAFYRARTFRETFKAKIEELEYRKLAGELVELVEVKRATFIRARRARDLLLSIPARLAPVLAGVSDPVECARLIEAEVLRVCDELPRPEHDPQ